MTRRRLVRNVFDHPVRSYSNDPFGNIHLRSRPPLLYEEGTGSRFDDFTFCATRPFSAAFQKNNTRHREDYSYTL
jgi:hypothetical protein